MKVNSFIFNSRIKKLILKLVFLLVIVIIIDMFYGFLTHKLFENNVTNHTPADIISKAINEEPELLVLGASRANHHYVPEIIKNQTGLSVYNSGLDGTNSCYTRDVLKIIIANHKPKIVIFDISNGLNFNTTGDLYKRHNQLSILKNYVQHFPNEVLNYSKEEKYLQNIYFYKYNSILSPMLFAFIKKDNHIVKSGYRPITGFDMLLEDPQKMFSHTDKYNSELYDALVDVIEICKKNDILLIFSTSPSYSYNENMIPLKFRNMLIEENISYLNYPIVKYEQLANKIYFKDINHLNNDGATLFTNIFVKDLIKIIAKDATVKKMSSIEAK